VIGLAHDFHFVRPGWPGLDEVTLRDLVVGEIDSGVATAGMDAQPVVAGALERQDGEFFVQVVVS
jgi:hypothetical protein